LNHDGKQLICVFGIRTDLRLCERKRRAVETKQSIFTNLNRWMLWHLERQEKTGDQQYGAFHCCIPQSDRDHYLIELSNSINTPKS
jgi:hypothetical protein